MNTRDERHRAKQKSELLSGGTPKSGVARWLVIYEKDGFDKKQPAFWIKQAAAVPGWIP